MASRKRKIGYAPVTASTTSMKRRKTLRPRKDAVHPFNNLPYELQLRTLSFCDKKTLNAVSLVSNNFREMALRVLWESQPVETFVNNFKQLDEHEDLRVAVRHLAVRRQSAPNKSRMSGVAKRLQARIPKDFFPGLTEFTIEFHTAQSDQFVLIMILLANKRPRNFKTLNIVSRYRLPTPDEEDAIKDWHQDFIIYPRGLTTIRMETELGYHMTPYDPLRAFDWNAETLTTVELNTAQWSPNFSIMVCPNVKTLTAQQKNWEPGAAKELAIKFPNVETLRLTLPQCGNHWTGANIEREMGKYVGWDSFKAAKTIQINQHAGFRPYMKPEKLKICAEWAFDCHQYLVEQWVERRMMMKLERVECWCTAPALSSRTLIHKFDIVLDVDQIARTVVPTRFKYLQEYLEDEDKEEDAESAKKDDEAE
ncbi:hypothetical protein ABW21_db0208858 [Orbilia brochopaga]|nr:hypothetical protein ABW21_db0208858 [Drechslerella brochopaga]